MTAPTIQSVQHDGTTLYIIFDRAVQNVADLDAFTFTITPGPSVITPSFSSIDDNAVIGTLVSPVGAAETLTVDYTDPGADPSQVQEAGSGDAANSFTGEVAVEYFSVSLVRRAEWANDGNNDTVTIFFGEPVGSTDGDLVAGFTVEINDVAIDLSSATASLNDDQTELTLDTGTNALFSDTVDVIYDSATGNLHSWPSGLVGDFTLNDIDNNSTDGLPTSSFPLSFVTEKELVVCGNAVEACLEVSLNPVDQELAKKYGPLTVFTGGTYGVTVGNPDGLTITGATETIVDGATICVTFTSTVDTKFATDAGADWQDVITTTIGNALGAARATEQSITFADDTITSV